MSKKTTEKRNAYIKEWRKRNPDKVRAYARAYYARHPERAKAAVKKCHQANGYAADRKWRKNNPDKVREIQRRSRQRNPRPLSEFTKAYQKTETWKIKQTAWRHRYYANPVNRMRRLIIAARWRAPRRNLAFDHDLFRVLLDNPPTTCACCGVVLDYEFRGKGQRHRDLSPSLDRLRSEVGYTVANVIVTCTRCNIVKNDSTADELRMILRYIERESKARGL